MWGLVTHKPIQTRILYAGSLYQQYLIDMYNRTKVIELKSYCLHMEANHNIENSVTHNMIGSGIL